MIRRRKSVTGRWTGLNGQALKDTGEVLEGYDEALIDDPEALKGD